MSTTDPAASHQAILESLRALLPDLRARHGIASLELFGSCARGAQGPGSEVDLLVEFDEPPSLLGFLALERELSEALGQPVDLVQAEALRGRIGEVIRSEAISV